MSETSEGTVIQFPEGVIGVPRARRFQVLERPGSPIRVLKCLDIEGFNLPVVDPRLTLDAVRGFGDAVMHVLQSDTPSRLLT